MTRSVATRALWTDKPPGIACQTSYQSGRDDTERRPWRIKRLSCVLHRELRPILRIGQKRRMSNGSIAEKRSNGLGLAQSTTPIGADAIREWSWTTFRVSPSCSDHARSASVGAHSRPRRRPEETRHATTTSNSGSSHSRRCRAAALPPLAAPPAAWMRAKNPTRSGPSVQVAMNTPYQPRQQADVAGRILKRASGSASARSNCARSRSKSSPARSLGPGLPDAGRGRRGGRRARAESSARAAAGCEPRRMRASRRRWAKCSELQQDVPKTPAC